jgi:hypothetical protein
MTETVFKLLPGDNSEQSYARVRIVTAALAAMRAAALAGNERFCLQEEMNRREAYADRIQAALEAKGMRQEKS